MESDEIAVELRKIANLLAIRQVKDLTKGEQALVLNRAGFSNREIAALIGSSEGSIRALISQGRKRTGEA